MKTILVVDDEPKIVELARDYLEHAGFAVADRGRRPVRARDGPPAPPGPRRPRPRPARARRPRRHPPAPRRDCVDPDRHAHGPRRRARQAARPRARRRRLPHQAVQPARARRPGAGGPAPGRAPARGRRDDPGRRPRRSTCRGCGPRWPAGPSSSRRPSSRCSRRSPADPGRIFTRSQLLDALHGVAFETLRAGDRLARQEPAPQARARPAPAALRPDRLRRRLPLRRRPRRPTDADRRRPRPQPLAGERPTWRGRPRRRVGRRGDGRGGREDWRASGGAARRRGGRRGPSRRRSTAGFGCLFGLLFLVVAGLARRASPAFVLSQLGPVPGAHRRCRPGRRLLAIDRRGRCGRPARTLDRARRRDPPGRGRRLLGPRRRRRVEGCRLDPRSS